MLLRNGWLVDSWCGPSVVARADVRVQDGKIAAIGPDLVAETGEHSRDLDGGVIAPGFVCGHTHLYSVLSRGMPATDPVPPSNFLEILQKVWWKLDRALDQASIRASARIGVLEALKCGTTGLLDHHASPLHVDGSLDIIAQACEDLGIRALLCYETSDRDGVAIRDAGVAENTRFARRNGNSPLVRGMIGAHASFTCSDDTLDRLAQACSDTDTGLHIHVAEGTTDRAMTRSEHGSELLGRLRSRGLNGAASIFGHCIDLTDDEINQLIDSGTRVAHNPSSNLNNRVGFRAPWLAAPNTTLLGTDGIGADMYAEAKMAFFRGAEAHAACSPGAILRMLHNNTVRLADAHSDADTSAAGRIAVGSAADLQILRYNLPTPLTADNLGGHFLFGMSAADVQTTVVAGRIVFDRDEYPGVDTEREYAIAREQAVALWQRMAG